jgi:hypothetical protein
MATPQEKLSRHSPKRCAVQRQTRRRMSCKKIILDFLDPLPEMWEELRIRHLSRLGRKLRHRLVRWNGSRQARAMAKLVKEAVK